MRLKLLQTKPAAQIASVLFALMLWIGVTASTVYEYTVSLPIQYIGPSEGYTVLGGTPDKVTLELRGHGSELFSFSIDRIWNGDEYYAIVNLTGFSEEGVHQVQIDQNRINVGSSGGIEINRVVSNGVFPVTIEKVIEVHAPVNTDSLPRYTVQKGYMVTGKARSAPEIVTLRGPRSVVESIRSVSVDKLLDTKISSDDTSLPATIGDALPASVTIEPREIEIRFRVEQVMRKLFVNVPVEIGGSTGITPGSVEPDSVTLDIEGPKSVMQRLSLSDIRVTVSRSTLLTAAGNSGLIHPDVIVPREASVVSIAPKQLRLLTE